MSVNRFFLVAAVLATVVTAMEFKFKLFDKGFRDGRQSLHLENLEMAEGTQIVNKQVSLTFRTTKNKLFTEIVEGKVRFVIWILILNGTDKIDTLEFRPMFIRVRTDDTAYLEPGLNLASHCDPKKEVKFSPPRLVRDRTLDLERQYQALSFYYTIKCTVAKKQVRHDEDLEVEPIPRFLKDRKSRMDWLEQSPTLPF